MPELATATPRNKRHAPASDQGHQSAYESGRAGEPFEGDPEFEASHRAGRQEHALEGLRDTRPVSGMPKVDLSDGAGILLGLVAYALLLNYLRYGLGGVRGWLAAKFINHPYQPGGASSPAAPVTPPSSTSPGAQVPIPPGIAGPAGLGLGNNLVPIPGQAWP